MRGEKTVVGAVFSNDGPPMKHAPCESAVKGTAPGVVTEFVPGPVAPPVLKVTAVAFVGADPSEELTTVKTVSEVRTVTLTDLGGSVAVGEYVSTDPTLTPD